MRLILHTQRQSKKVTKKFHTGRHFGQLIVLFQRFDDIKLIATLGIKFKTLCHLQYYFQDYLT